MGRVLALPLRPEVRVMDNLGLHKGGRVREPIKEVFSKLKALLRREKVRTGEALSLRRWARRSVQ